MRMETDRREVLKLYEEIFGVTPFINPHPRVQINPQYLSVGNAFVERNHYQPTKIFRNQLHLLPGFGHSLEAALNCVQHQWLCIMVGPSSSGKTSLIRLLSQLTGNVLNELNLSSGTEISELLGCFEQYDAFRNLRSVIAEVEHYIAEYSSLRLVSFPEGLAAGCRDLIARWLSFLSSINYSSSMSSFDSAFGESWKSGSCNMLGELVEIIKLLQHDIEKYKLPVSMSHRDLNKSLNTVLVLHENSRTQSFSSKFEWVTGLLIKAVERGEWVILENANLCNPTVLDRINSLVEPTRSITINECGLVDGKPVILHAHPNFRMFLTVNPRYGEVSRAMRNRGVEVFMMQSDWLHQVNGYDCKETEARNVETFLVLSGIPIYKLVVAMSKAHIYARDAGLHLGIHLTLLELTRWVQLFQQLLMTGNRLRWSLQLSWEHTYLSSLGEAEGKDIIMHAKQSFLSRSEAPELDLVVGCSLSLPGGWPEPLKFGKFLFFPTESSIKQNVMYLEFLGAQCGAYELSVDKKESMMIQAGSITATGNLQTSLLNNSKKLKPFVIPFQMLHAILFPTSSSQKNFMFNEHENFDLALANKMLFFAANWTIEQATENDLLLYDLWFNWYSTRLQPYCSFFKSFLAILKQERDRPIWMHIVDCWREIISCLEINVVAQPIPLLSLDLVELAASNEKLKSFRERLYNASRSVSLLRLSFQQWNAEDHYAYGEEKIHFSVLPVLKSLRQLEEGVLDVIVESPYFDILIQLYNQLLEYHTLFWKGITMSQFEGLLISWRSLKKVAIKLHGVFPGGVDTFLAECRNLDKLASWKFNSPKPMLWVHGGHPFLPSSQDIYSKMQQLVSFCDVVWPKTTISSKQEKDYLVEAVVSTNTELRYLAMQGVCMSSYIISKGGQDDAAVVHQLDEIYQMLLGRYEFEKHKMEAVLASTTQFPNALLVESTTSACCTFCPEMLCRKPGFDSWLETLPLLDEKSFLLDFVLFQELSNNIFVDASELYLVLSKSSKLLEYVMNFSLSFSSRTPIDFSPHQKLLWMLDVGCLEFSGFWPDKNKSCMFFTGTLVPMASVVVELFLKISQERVTN